MKIVYMHYLFLSMLCTCIAEISNYAHCVYRYGLIFWSDLNDGLILAGKFDGSERRTVADIGIKRPG